MQDLVPKVPPRLLRGADRRARRSGRLTHWSFGHYLEIAHHRLVTAGPPPQARRTIPQRVAA